MLFIRILTREAGTMSKSKRLLIGNICWVAPFAVQSSGVTESLQLSHFSDAFNTLDLGRWDQLRAMQNEIVPCRDISARFKH